MFEATWDYVMFDIFGIQLVYLGAILVYNLDNEVCLKCLAFINSLNVVGFHYIP